MKTGQEYDASRLAMTHSHGIGSRYVIIGNLAKEVGPQVATVTAQIFCLGFRRAAVVTRNGAGRVKHEVNPAIVRVPRRGNGREQDEQGKNLGNELHGGDESSVLPTRLSNP